MGIDAEGGDDSQFVKRVKIIVCRGILEIEFQYSYYGNRSPV